MDVSKMYYSKENLLDGDNEEYVTIVSPEKYKNKGNKDKWPELKQFMLDISGKSFLGRPQHEWRRLVAFYGVFYLSLLVYYGIMIGVFTAILDEIHPWQRGMASPLKLTPGLSFRPLPFFQTKLIRFIQGKPETYKPFTDHIQAFLFEYENEKQVGENFVDCEKGKPPEQIDKVCRFDVDTLGGACNWQTDYGYDEGTPCVLLKLNKIYGWYPNTYQQEDAGDADLPDDFWDRWSGDHVGITCEGRYSADHENIGNITYWPPQGFPRFFYPYLNQEGFRSPLVMIRFDNPANGILINVACKAWAKNIRHHLNDQLGVVTFEIMVD